MFNSLFDFFSQLFSLTECFGCQKESSKPICDTCVHSIDRYTIQPGSELISYGRYEGILKTLIHQFKYENKFGLAKPLALLLSDMCPKKADIIIPIPLHLEKLRVRKYNQSQLLAKELSQVVHIPTSPTILKKVKPTLSQTDLSREERKRNVKGVFKVYNPHKVRDKHVILIDDVYTSGATIKEASHVLAEHGTGKISVLTLAR